MTANPTEYETGQVVRPITPGSPGDILADADGEALIFSEAELLGNAPRAVVGARVQFIRSGENHRGPGMRRWAQRVSILPALPPAPAPALDPVVIAEDAEASAALQS